MEPFELRHLTYFLNKNVFVGSCGPLRYRLAPSGDRIAVFAWKDDRCFECQESPQQIQVPMSAEGLAQAVDWLKKQL